MKTSRILVLAALVTSVLATPLAMWAADNKAEKKAGAVKPYPLKTCIVADDKLDKDAVSFQYEGREYKLCCESCRKDFDKEPAKFVKKLADAEKKLKK